MSMKKSIMLNFHPKICRQPGNSSLLSLGWSFTDYGPEYTAFSNAGIDGGFYRSDLAASSVTGGALIVFYSSDLEKTKSKIENAGGSVVMPVFRFPGGRRFHFTDPNGNEYAVWSDVDT